MEIVEWQQKVKALEDKIVALNVKLDEAAKLTNAMTDEKLKFEAELDKKDSWVHMLQEDIVRLKDEVKGKDLAI